MKKIMIAALLLISVGAYAQPTFYKTDKLYTKSLYIRDVRVDSISNDTNFTNPSIYNVPNQFAIKTFVNRSIANNTSSSIAWANVTSKVYASGILDGILAHSDWLGFNGKQDALNGTGLVRMSGTTVSYDNTSYLPLTGGTLSSRLRGTSLILNKDSVPIVTGRLWATIIDTSNGNIICRQLLPTVSGTNNYIPKFTGTNTIGNSSMQELGNGIVIGNVVTPTANGQTLYAIDFASTYNLTGFSGITQGGYRFNGRVLVNSNIEQYSTSNPSVFSGYNLLTGGTGTTNGTIMFGTLSTNQQQGFASQFGGGFSKLSAFVQLNAGTPSQFVVNIGNSERFIFNGNSELLINTTTSTGDKLNCNGAVRATQFKLSALNTAPSSSSDTGGTGEIRIVNGFIYVCVATNTWQRATLSTF